MAGLASKGRLVVGADADIVAFDPEGSQLLDERVPIFHQHSSHPYIGRLQTGRVAATFVRGQLVYEGDDHTHAEAPCGRPLLRTAA